MRCGYESMWYCMARGKKGSWRARQSFPARSWLGLGAVVAAARRNKQGGGVRGVRF